MKNIKQIIIFIVVFVITFAVGIYIFQKFGVSDKADNTIEQVDIEQQSSADSVANNADIFD